MITKLSGASDAKYRLTALFLRFLFQLFLCCHPLSVKTDANLEGAEICLASLFVSIRLVNLTENMHRLWRFNQKFGEEMKSTSELQLRVVPR